MNTHSPSCPDSCDAACECPIPEPVFGNVTKFWYCFTCGHDLKNKYTGFPFVADRVGSRGNVR